MLLAALAVAAAAAAAAAPAAAALKPTARLSAVPFTRVAIDDSFWAPRRKTNCEVSVPHQFAMNAQTGRIDAWRLQ
jgi:ABC-type sugar transport system substrate-binding protein